MIDFFTDPLAYQFFRNGLYAATLSGALCGMMGVYIVLRRMSYIGHGLSHAIFGGAVVAYVMSWNVGSTDSRTSTASPAPPAASVA